MAGNTLENPVWQMCQYLREPDKKTIVSVCCHLLTIIDSTHFTFANASCHNVEIILYKAYINYIYKYTNSYKSN